MVHKLKTEMTLSASFTTTLYPAQWTVFLCAFCAYLFYINNVAVITVASVNTCRSTCLSVCLGAIAPSLKIHALQCSVINTCDHKQLFSQLKPDHDIQLGPYILYHHFGSCTPPQWT